MDLPKGQYFEVYFERTVSYGPGDQTIVRDLDFWTLYKIKLFARNQDNPTSVIYIEREIHTGGTGKKTAPRKSLLARTIGTIWVSTGIALKIVTGFLLITVIIAT